MINLIPFKQSDSSRCGPAAVRMVLDYYGIDTTEEELCNRCKWTYEEGCDDEGMKEAIESYGLGCEILNFRTLEDIKYWVKHHVPIIVDWFSGGPGEMPNGHSSVVVEMDREKIYLMDPEIGQVRGVLKEDFLRVWFDWKKTAKIETWDNMVIRQIIIVFPNRLTTIN